MKEDRRVEYGIPGLSKDMEQLILVCRYVYMCVCVWGGEAINNSIFPKHKL